MNGEYSENRKQKSDMKMSDVPKRQSLQNAICLFCTYFLLSQFSIKFNGIVEVFYAYSAIAFAFNTPRARTRVVFFFFRMWHRLPIPLNRFNPNVRIALVPVST